MENKTPFFEGETYGYEIPAEVRENWLKGAKIRKPIPEERVADLKKVDISNSPYRFVKRGLDFVISLIFLILLAAPMLIIALLIFITEPGKVIFSQHRIGLNGKRFKVYKFRSMRLKTPAYMPTGDVRNPKRYITPVGRVLRKTSLDEIPQLFNVLKGDMSLIGPRPLIPDEVDIHSMRMRFGAYQVRPGITGLAQINGRDCVSPANKVRMDVQYANNFSLKQDLGILFSTLPRVLAAAGIVEGAQKKDK